MTPLATAKPGLLTVWQETEADDCPGGCPRVVFGRTAG